MIHTTIKNVKKIESFAIIEGDAYVGNNVYIGHFAIIRPGVFLCDNVEIRAHCFIAEDVCVGENTHIFQFTNIAKGAIIEEDVWIGAHNMFTNTRNIAHKRPYPTRIYPPHILRGARIGSNCTFTPGVTVGENAVIGAGSVVTKDVPDNMLVMGRPATIVKEVPINERI